MSVSLAVPAAPCSCSLRTIAACSLVELPVRLWVYRFSVQVRFSAAAIPKLTRNGKPMVAVVTGANTGIGYVTALELARNGAHVVLACRDKHRAEVTFNSYI